LSGIGRLGEVELAEIVDCLRIEPGGIAEVSIYDGWSGSPEDCVFGGRRWLFGDEGDDILEDGIEILILLEKGAPDIEQARSLQLTFRVFNVGDGFPIRPSL